MLGFLNSNKISTETTFPVDNKIKLLITLIVIDLIIIGLNFYNSWVPDDQWTPFLALVNDDSLGELIQYTKWFLIALSFVYLTIKRSAMPFLSWALIFTYLLLDDSLAIHEIVGGYLMQNASFEAPMGLRLQDIGELLVSAMAGSVLLVFSIWAYLKGNDFYKSVTQSMLYLFIALVLFGVVFDAVAVMLSMGAISDFIFGVIEDGGEMFVASFMLWYIILVLNAGILAVTLMKSINSISPFGKAKHIPTANIKSFNFR